MTGEFAQLAREGYPINDLLRMAGADYLVWMQCPCCGKMYQASTGDEEYPEYDACGIDCERALIAAARR